MAKNDTNTDAPTTTFQIPTAPVSTGAPLYVDNKVVSEEEYFKAAEGTYDLNFLRHHPEVRPAISTKKHGEQ